MKKRIKWKKTIFHADFLLFVENSKKRKKEIFPLWNKAFLKSCPEFRIDENIKFTNNILKPSYLSLLNDTFN